MQFDATEYRYPSRRTTVYGTRGMVATTQPLAAEAGLEMIKKGGNAVDAAIATAACLTVVEPTGCGIGGDAFALVWADGKLHGLNSSGTAPMRANADVLRAKGFEKMPLYGWHAVNVPGTPAAWAELSARFGRLPLTEVLKPAIYYARNGFPVSPYISTLWKKAFSAFEKNLKGPEFKHIFDSFTINGRAPAAGELWRCPDQGDTLELIAETKAEAFYSGALAEKIAAFSKAHDGWLSAEDLAAYKPEWVTPISVDYRGYDVWEIPPSGQGIVALMALNILKHFEFSERETVDAYHLQIEATKLAFADALKYVADPRSMDVSVEALLSASYGAKRAKEIDLTRAAMPAHGAPNAGGTVYLSAADGDGGMISFIQSNYRGFGSGLAVPGTGITLHNRGNNFSLDPASPNCLAPGKKPYHTIIPGFLTKDGQPVGPFGVMGAFMQPQGHVQTVMNLVDFGMNPQEAFDAPRWQWIEGMQVGIEAHAGTGIAHGLDARGHEVLFDCDTASYGRGEMILRCENDVLCGATEPRSDGHVAVW